MNLNKIKRYIFWSIPLLLKGISFRVYPYIFWSIPWCLLRYTFPGVIFFYNITRQYNYKKNSSVQRAVGIKFFFQRNSIINLKGRNIGRKFFFVYHIFTAYPTLRRKKLGSGFRLNVSKSVRFSNSWISDPLLFIRIGDESD